MTIETIAWAPLPLPATADVPGHETGPARDDVSPAVVLHVATMDGRVDTDRYPAGRYALHVYNQGAPAAPIVGATVTNLDSRGLARSRNALLDAGTDGISVIGDDDVRYLPGFDDTIRRAYAARPDADLILFSIRTPEGRPFGRYRSAPGRLGALGLLRRCSIEITFRADAVRRAGLRFDERFGLGARHRTGEDIVFLDDARRAGLVIDAVPDFIAEHPAQSSGAAHDARLFADKGAMFVRLYGAAGVAVALAYTARKAPSCRPALGMAAAMRATAAGAIGFLAGRES